MNEKIKRRSPVKVCVIFIVTMFIICSIARYIADEEFRSVIDTHVFKKELTESTLATIEINSDANPYVFAYKEYINVLSKNTLMEYLADGKLAGKIDVSISVPLIDSNDKYFVLAEKNGQKIYLISDSNIIWQSSLEGNISKVNVNENGYVSVIITNTTYKSVVVVFSPDGTELFRRYISSNYAICTDVSNDNEYLAIGEIDYKGTIMKSYIKIISMSRALSNPENALLNTFESSNGEIITNLKYNSKNDVICMFDKSVQKITKDGNEKIYDIEDDDLFVDIDLKDAIAIIDKQSSGLFSYEYELTLKNTQNKTDNLYILDNEVPKTMIIKENLIGLNFGNEVQIVNENGWLVKRYTSSKEIRKLVLGNNIAGVVYKNKIEIISL